MKKIGLLVILFFIFVFASANAQTFTKDLYFGIQSDPEVTKLQEFLTEQGVYSGPITGNFFSLTLRAVKQFQINNNITPPAGYFGPKTKVKANEILSSQVESSESQAVAETGATTTVPIPPKTTTDVVNSLQAQLNALLQQVALLQQQLQTQQQMQTGIQNLQSQVSQQNQVIQQIQQNTQQIQQNTQPQTTPPPANQTNYQLIASVSPMGGSTHAMSNIDDFGTITFSANSVGQIAINKLTITFSGNAVSGNLLGKADLLDQNGNSLMNTSDVSSSTDVASCATDICTKTWGLGDGTSGWIISAGRSYTFRLRLNTTAIQTQTSTTMSLAASIQNSSDVTFTGITSGMTLPTSIVPLVINSLTYISSPINTTTTATGPTETSFDSLLKFWGVGQRADFADFYFGDISNRTVTITINGQMHVVTGTTEIIQGTPQTKFIVRELTPETKYNYTRRVERGNQFATETGELTTKKDLTCGGYPQPTLSGGMYCSNNTFDKIIRITGVNVSLHTNTGETSPTMTLYDPYTNEKLFEKQYPPAPAGINANEPPEDVIFSHSITIQPQHLSRQQTMALIGGGGRYILVHRVDYEIDGATKSLIWN